MRREITEEDVRTAVNNDDGQTDAITIALVLFLRGVNALEKIAAQGEPQTALFNPVDVDQFHSDGLGMAFTDDYAKRGVHGNNEPKRPPCMSCGSTSDAHSITCKAGLGS